MRQAPFVLIVHAHLNVFAAANVIATAGIVMLDLLYCVVHHGLWTKGHTPSAKCA